MTGSSRTGGQTRRRGPRPARRPAAWLGLAAVLVNLLLALAPPQVAAADAGGRAGSLLADLYAICTAQGLVDVSGEDAPGAVASQPHCVFCLPLSNPGAGLLAPDAPPAPRLLAGSARLTRGPPPEIRLTAPTPPTAYRTRAPPVSLAIG